MKTSEYHAKQIRIVPCARGFDVFYGGEFIGFRKTLRGANGLKDMEAQRLAHDDAREAGECRQVARDLLGRVGYMAEA